MDSLCGRVNVGSEIDSPALRAVYVVTGQATGHGENVMPPLHKAYKSSATAEDGRPYDVNKRLCLHRRCLHRRCVEYLATGNFYLLA